MSGASPRNTALNAASERNVRQFPRPTEGGRPLSVREVFGRNVFGREQLRQYLPGEVLADFERIQRDGGRLDSKMAARIAVAVHDWATARGVTHFCHWFQPMTGLTAEKHDAFLTFDGDLPISKLSASQLIQSEPDASSFPSGGMRSTFEARGYTAWDPTSPMFIMERETGSTLCIPSVFVSYHGPALDKKTPLLRSMRAISQEAVALLHLLGDTEVRRVQVTAGPEQEYFLVDKAFQALRPDLVIGGRTILGASAPKGQSLEDHYFGAIPSRVQAFMHELELELYKVGVPAKTRHNEVAPGQFEIAVLHAEANLAADHNQLVMELLRRVAERHDYRVLLHEKPYAGVNGSGKHINWSMADDQGRNLLDPGNKPGDNRRFLAFLAATLLGVYRHADLLRASIASHGNDFRLGANEAPPAIISAFLGEQLTQVVHSLLQKTASEAQSGGRKLQLEIGGLPDLAQDSTDRNRTSPFAFTGNKFEFRACGSQMSVSWPTTCVNVAVAEGIRELRVLAEKLGDLDTAIAEALRMSQPICFEGNNYSEEWVVEAEKRGLPHLRKTPEALAVLHQERIADLFAAHNVLRPAELEARYHIQVERYIHSVDIEADLMRDLIDQHILPAAIEELGSQATALGAARASGLSEDPWKDFGNLALPATIRSLRAAREALDAAASQAAGVESLSERAAAYAKWVLPVLEQIRTAADQLEGLVSDARWPLPKYREMLFQNH